MKVHKIHCEGNVFVLPEIKTIIDTSNNEDKDYIKTEVSKIINPEEIKTVLLTHMHYDHCGNVDLFPNAKVYASKTEIESFIKHPLYSLFGEEITDECMEKLQNAIPFQEISQGELQSKRGHPGVKVIELPGHTSGSVAFIDEKNKIIFTGDTYFREGVYGRTDLPTSIPEKMQSSLDKIQEYIDKEFTVYPGHDY